VQLSAIALPARHLFKRLPENPQFIFGIFRPNENGAHAVKSFLTSFRIICAWSSSARASSDPPT